MITQRINLNLIPGGVMPRINVSQYDFGSRAMEITLYNGASLYTIPQDANILIQGTKPDKTGFQYEHLSYSGSVVTANLEKQMTIFSGEQIVELVIKVDGEQLATANFVLNIEPSALADDTVISESVIPGIHNLDEYLIACRNYAILAESWAVGGTGTRAGEDTNNSKYWCDQAHGGGGGKQTGTITLSPNSVSVNSGSTATVTVTKNTDGAISVSSSDNTKATATLSGNTLTVTGVASGNATITLSAPETENYTACSTTLSVAVASSQQTGTITLSKNSTSISVGDSDTVTFTTNSDGVPTVTSSNNSVATASLSGTTITIQAQGIGNATITVNIPATTNYTEASATLSVESEGLEIGKTYTVGGTSYQAVYLHYNAQLRLAVFQSLGLNAGSWPGSENLSQYAASTYMGNLSGVVNNIRLVKHTFEDDGYFYDGSSFIPDPWPSSYTSLTSNLATAARKSSTSEAWTQSAGTEGNNIIVLKDTGQGSISIDNAGVSRSKTTPYIAPTFTISIDHVKASGSNITYK